MQTTLAVEDIKVTLPALLVSLTQGDEVTLTRNKQLVSEPAKPRLRPPPGQCKGMITIVSDDDERLKDFAEYMP